MDLNLKPPPAAYNYIDLSLTKLHYVTCGEGPPLIMVPATMSKTDNWLPLAQFMGQRFTVHFFELPGHGKSTPFQMQYASKHVAESLGDFLEALGFSSAALLGFSFGGILALHTLNHLQEKINKVILISPCVSTNAVLLSRSRMVGLRQFLAFLKIPLIQKGFISFLHNERYGYFCAALIRRLGKVENTIALEEILCRLPASTLDVLIYQANEILNLEFPGRKPPYSQKCYFAMSVNDPVLDFQTTLDFLDGYFTEVRTERFTFPYHQPPVLPTFAELNQHYGHFLDLIL
jgi:pimeloyl-ACP methyl ester carboxylesterase